MKSAYATSGKIFEQVSMYNSPALLDQLRAIPQGDIVVVQGTYDHIEQLLPTIKVPFELIQPDEIKKHNGGRVMFVNCRTYGDGNAVEGAARFVEEGGRLVTTDWAVSLATRAFPGKLSKVNETTDDVVEIQCHTDIARRFVGLNYAQCHPKWWLESSSHIYTIKNGVTPLITSEEMKEKYGQPYVLVGFGAGKGEVFHFISHLELQRTQLRNKQDKAGLEAFLEKMGASKTAEMDDATVAELEAAYSTLNTLAHLCSPTPILNAGMKSATTLPTTGATASAKSKRLV
ncbi:hypothetical protein HY486_02575 [Candidatus Woesearchaeota archaeon]|nr:hypothetical protein [Candidatus Woesearchaeota archaeon]